MERAIRAIHPYDVPEFLVTEAIGGGAFQHRWLWAPGLRLGGGSDEIMKNIIAERILGLPGDPRVDKDVAFKDIPRGR